MLVQELCGGGDLRSLLTNSPDIVRRKGHYWAVQISSAMQHLHEMNVIHR